MPESDRENLHNAVIGRKPEEITIVFDFDGVICRNNNGDYKNAPPIPKTISNINRIYDSGYRVVIATARYGQRHPGKQYQYGFLEAVEWLKINGVKYHELRMGKEAGDLYIDDKGFRLNPDNNDDWDEIHKLIDDLTNKNQYGQYLNG